MWPEIGTVQTILDYMGSACFRNNGQDLAEISTKDYQTTSEWKIDFRQVAEGTIHSFYQVFANHGTLIPDDNLGRNNK